MTREIIRTFTNISVNLPTRRKGRVNSVDENILFDYYIRLLLFIHFGNFTLILYLKK